jgi:hypothetical protein
VQKNLTYPGQGKRFSGLIMGVVIAVLFLIWALFILLLVGDKGPPSWDFGVVEDIPGQSPYSTNRF